MSNTIFKHRKHAHVFYKINESQTKVSDEIEFELQYGLIGKMFEWYALDKLKRIYAYKQQATIKSLSNILNSNAIIRLKIILNNFLTRNYTVDGNVLMSFGTHYWLLKTNYNYVIIGEVEC